MNSSPAASPYRPEIDGLRAVAVLAVLANHMQSKMLPGGFLGVDVFFVISGYVITSSLVHRQESAFSAFVISFYARRFRRLIPALLICILISSIIYCLFVQIPNQSIWTGLAGVFGFSNLQLYFGEADYFAAAAELNIFLHTWSLGVEEQFYLLYPLIFWLAMKRQRLLKRLVFFAGAAVSVAIAIAFLRAGLGVMPDFLRAQGKGPYGLLLVSLLALGFAAYQPALLRPRFRSLFLTVGILSGVSLLFFLLLSPSNPSAAFYLMPNRFWEIGVGCLLALVADPSLRSEEFAQFSYRLRAGSGVSLAMICGCFFLPPLWKSVATPLVVLLTLLLLLATDCDPSSRGLAKRFLSLPLMISIGLISYSLYLWHWPVLVLARWTIGIQGWSLPLLVMVMAGASLASYRWVEGPLRKAQWASKNEATIGYGLLAQGLLAGGLFSLLSQPANPFYTGRNASAFDLASLSVSGTAMTVDRCGYLDDKTVETCQLKPRGINPSLYLFGDSHAGHLYPMMGEIVARTGVGLATFNTAGNAHQPFPVISFGSSPEGKRNDYLDRLPDKAREINAFYNLVSPSLKRGDSVLLAVDLPRYFNHKQPDQDPLFIKWAVAIAKLASALEPRGVHVIAFAPFPHFLSGGGPFCIRQWFRPRLDASCFAILPLKQVREESDKIVSALQRLGAKHSNLHVYDPLLLFCDPVAATCRNHKADDVFYLDGNHLSPSSAALVAGDFGSFLHNHGLLP